MNLVLISDQDRTDFLEWLKPYCLRQFLTICDIKKLKLYEEFIQEIVGYKAKPHEILIYALNRLQIRQMKKEYILEVNPNIYLPKTTVKVIDLCKLIEYGNTELRAYPILEKTFQNILDNFDFYKKLYK